MKEINSVARKNNAFMIYYGLLKFVLKEKRVVKLSKLLIKYK